MTELRQLREINDEESMKIDLEKRIIDLKDDNLRYKQLNKELEIEVSRLKVNNNSNRDEFQKEKNKELKNGESSSSILRIKELTKSLFELSEKYELERLKSQRLEDKLEYLDFQGKSSIVDEMKGDVQKDEKCTILWQNKYWQQRNETLLFKRQLQLAKSVISRETGLDCGEVQELLGSQVMAAKCVANWKGRQETIGILRKKLAAIKGKDENWKKKDEISDSEKKTSNSNQSSSDRKKIIETLEYEKKRSIEEISGLKHCIKALKSRNENLSKESQVQKKHILELLKKSDNDNNLLEKLR
ncbi:MAG: hypothetical protein MHMPM18_001414, partial [Marteilia pararefringens]